MTKTNLSATQAIFRLLLPVAVLALLALTPSAALAQDKYQGTGSIDIFNRDIVTDGDEDVSYHFTIDVKGLFSSGIKEITDLSIQTNHGDIVFDGPIKVSEEGQFDSGLLESKDKLTEIQLVKAIGTVDGKKLDLTDLFHVRDFTPLTITVKPAGK
jgi:hypothetical protein